MSGGVALRAALVRGAAREEVRRVVHQATADRRVADGRAEVMERSGRRGGSGHGVPSTSDGAAADG